MGGPYKDLLNVSPKDAKRDERLRTSGELLRYTFDGKDFPLTPRTIFYNYIYINALLENEALSEKLLAYDAFTDIAFNPEKSMNCQAKAAAVFVSLSRMGLLDRAQNFEDFRKLCMEKPGLPRETADRKPVSETVVKEETPYETGDTIVHKVWGKGEIVAEGGTTIRVKFPGVGEKVLGKAWRMENCRTEKKE